MIKKTTSALLLMAGCAINAHAVIPAGGWTLKDGTPDSKDYALRIDVDPGETYEASQEMPSNAYWAEDIMLKWVRGGNLGLSRENGQKFAVAQIWGALDVKPGILPAMPCEDSVGCISLKGNFDWKLGHHYRFRIEKSPRTPSDRAGQWWQITLADLTSSTISLLGEIKTHLSEGIDRSNDVFLQYPTSPSDCLSLRHTRATMGQIRGVWGLVSALESSNGESYGDPDLCDPQNRLPGMTPKDYGSSSSDKNGTLSLVGNNLMGMFQWGDFGGVAKKGMMFVKDLSEEEPYLYEALEDGKYGIFPREGRDNQYWKSIGKGYPIINDLRLRHQRLREWEERNDDETALGDYFIYHNSYSHETEYFKLINKNAGYFPVDKSDNDNWHYVGRYPKKDEALTSHLTLHYHDGVDGTGKKNWLYYDMTWNAFHILREDGKYGAFPASPGDNQWWQYIGHFS